MIKPVRDEQKKRKLYHMFFSIFKDLSTFKKELKALVKKKPFKTKEMSQHYLPKTAVSVESYMYALDKYAVID